MTHTPLKMVKLPLHLVTALLLLDELKLVFHEPHDLEQWQLLCASASEIIILPLHLVGPSPSTPRRAHSSSMSPLSSKLTTTVSPNL